MRVRNGTIYVEGRSLDLQDGESQALGQYLAALSPLVPEKRIEHYLAHLCLRPHFQKWHQRYVTLSGSYRDLEPHFSKILVRGEGPQREIERVHLDDIRAAIDEHTSAILLAQPGAGKTTVLRKLGLDLALLRLQNDGERLPLYVPLANQQPDETPDAFLARRWCEEMPGTTADDFRQALREGKLCLLCDALNEARRANYQARVDDWRDFAAHLPGGNRLLFSCRTLDYNGVLRVQQVEIDPLSDDQIRDFGRRYLGAEKGQTFWEHLAAEQQELPPGEEQKGLMALARIPYYLHMLVDVFAEQGELPAHRATLFEDFALKLLQREEEKRHPHWIRWEAQHVALGKLAFAMQAQGEGTELRVAEVAENLPAEVMVEGERVPTPPQTIVILAHAATLLSRAAGDQQREEKIKFAHHLLQEYFAAEELLRRYQDEEPLDALWRVSVSADDLDDPPRGEYDPLPLPPTSGWEQTTILAAGLNPELVQVVRPVNPALAARCLLESGMTVDAQAKEQVQRDLLARMGFEPTLADGRARVAAGQVAPDSDLAAPTWTAKPRTPVIHLRAHVDAGESGDGHHAGGLLSPRRHARRPL